MLQKRPLNFPSNRDTSLDHALVTAALKETLDTVGNLEHYEADRSFRIVPGQEKIHPSIAKLVETLRAQPSLNIFNGRMQCLNYGIRWELRDLADWLIRRGLNVGIAQAATDLQRYLPVTQIPFAMVLGLAGLAVEKLYHFGGGIDLLPWKHLPKSYKKRMEEIVSGASYQLKWPSAALVRKIMLPKFHIPDREPLPPVRIDDSELKDAVLFIGVVGPFAPEVLVSWLEPPPWVPTMGGAFSRPILEGLPRHDVLTDDHFETASRLFETFRKLSSEKKDILRLPLQRLSKAMRGSSEVDSLVDLGIAMEALFLKDREDDRGELSFRLRLRIARYLEQDIEKRKKLFEYIRVFYKLRSIAVHTGSVSPKEKKSKPTSEILLEGYRLTAEAIRRFITEGIPDWDKIELQ